MVLKNSRTGLCGLVAFVSLCSALSAAPKLRLAQTAISISSAAGSDAAAQSVDAANIGDGSLNLQVTTSAPWLAASIGGPHSCVFGSTCIPIQIAVPSSSLANGTYTGTVTVSDPNAIDAPQFIVVTLAVGGYVPNSLEFYLPPGSSTTSDFSTRSRVSVSSDSPWLSVALNGIGSFIFNVPYRVTVSAAGDMPAADYNGTITVSGSTFAPDNKAIPVLLHVTTTPVLQTLSNSIQFQIAQGASPQTQYLGTTSSNPGAISIAGVTATSMSGTWLSAQVDPNNPGIIDIVADPTGLAPGIYQETVTINSNAANGSLTVPVQLTVELPAAPVVFPFSVVNQGTFVTGELLAPGDLVVLSGDQFTYSAPQQVSGPPWDVSLGGTQVLVNGEPAPISSLSPGQIQFQIPFDASLGDGLVQVIRSDQQSSNLVSVSIAALMPRFLLFSGGPFINALASDGTQTGIPSHPVTAGDSVALFAVGLGPTTPSIASGAASPDRSAVVPATQVCFGYLSPFLQPLCTPATFAGLTPNQVGVYEIDCIIPSGIETGTVPIFITVGETASENQQIAVQ